MGLILPHGIVGIYKYIGKIYTQEGYVGRNQSFNNFTYILNDIEDFLSKGTLVLIPLWIK